MSTLRSVSFFVILVSFTVSCSLKILSTGGNAGSTDEPIDAYFILTSPSHGSLVFFDIPQDSHEVSGEITLFGWAADF